MGLKLNDVGWYGIMMNHGTDALLKQSPSNAKTTFKSPVSPAGIKIIQVIVELGLSREMAAANIFWNRDMYDYVNRIYRFYSDLLVWSGSSFPESFHTE